MRTHLITSDSRYYFERDVEAMLARGWKILSPVVHTQETPTSGWAKGILCHTYAQTFFKEDAPSTQHPAESGKDGK